MSVALADDGTTALVDAGSMQGGDDEEVLVAYLFTRDGDGWSQVARLNSDPGGTAQISGRDVALAGDGETAIVGSRLADDEDGGSVGAARVYTSRGGNWVQQAELLAPEGEWLGGFGDAVALTSDGETALVGAPDYDSRGTDNTGAAYLFSRGSGGWSLDAKLAATEGTTDTTLGDAVALGNRGTAIVGASGSSEGEDTTVSGAVYVFDV